ncbi:MAG: ribonuclease [Gaiellales bacterium]|nr:ribonuclease [Gaiellales bacterium]
MEVLRGESATREFAALARAEGRVALDTEFWWERTYAPVLCLLQAATRERIVLIDPQEGGLVGPIAELVVDPAVELVMHAPAADLLLFALREDSRATNVFDTQVAAGFAGFGAGAGYERLVEAALGVRLQHNETFSDWRRRPLSETQLAYAADDVRYLFPLADTLHEQLTRLGRAAWADDELHDRFGDPSRIEPDPARAWMKIARRGRLSPRQTAVLAEVAAWREREARRRDLPPGWLVKDPSLVEVARAQPTDSAALRRVRGLGTLGSAEASLIDAVQAGKQAPAIEAQREPAPEIARRAAAISGLATVLLRVRSDDAGIASELVATRSELDDFARAAARGDASDHQLSTGWRAELVGDELRRLLDGKIAVATSTRPPYVEIIERD